jgi:hypothetical protein
MDRRAGTERRQVALTPAVERRLVADRRSGERRTAVRRVLITRRVLAERRRVSGPAVLA